MEDRRDKRTDRICLGVGFKWNFSDRLCVTPSAAAFVGAAVWPTVDLLPYHVVKHLAVALPSSSPSPFASSPRRWEATARAETKGRAALLL